MNNAEKQSKISKITVRKKFPQLQFRLYIASYTSENDENNQKKAR